MAHPWPQDLKCPHKWMKPQMESEVEEERNTTLRAAVRNQAPWSGAQGNQGDTIIN